MTELSTKDKVKNVLDQIRPALQADGGDVELVEVTPDGVVKVKLHGACSHCMGAIMTLKNVVEARIRAVAPEIKSVERVG
ncbi:MAG: NifU family protein [Proteobacteria bacterium]|nr:NifU family protein [Pseudomonadota bacterium]